MLPFASTEPSSWSTFFGYVERIMLASVRKVSVPKPSRNQPPGVVKAESGGRSGRDRPAWEG
ncbi:hypothetical protein RM555_18855, partial [Micromonospora sp. DSM 115977]